MKNTKHPRTSGGFYRLLSASLIAMSALMFSCTNPDELGLDFIDDQLGTKYTDTLTIEAHSVKVERLRTDMAGNLLAGYINDPVFGKTQAGFYVQFRLSSNNVYLGQGALIDSVVLSLVYGGFYGDTLHSQKFTVWEITEPFLRADTSIQYYSNQSLEISENFIIEKTFAPRIKSLVDTTTHKTWPPHLRLKLSDEFANKLLAAGDTASASYSMSNNEVFTNAFPGLFIQGQPIEQTGAIVYFPATNTYNRLNIYYKNPPSNAQKTLTINVREESAKYNRFDRFDFVGASAGLYQQVVLGDTAMGDSILFVSSMAGTKVKLKVPHLKEIGKLGNRVAVNKAQLIITADTSFVNPAHFKLLDRFGLVGVKTDSTIYYLRDDDSFIGGTYFGGGYASKTKQYVFNVTRHVQDVIDGKTENFDLNILAGGAFTNAGRSVLFGPKHSQYPMKLIIAYTILE